MSENRIRITASVRLPVATVKTVRGVPKLSNFDNVEITPEVAAELTQDRYNAINLRGRPEDRAAMLEMAEAIQAKHAYFVELEENTESYPEGAALYINLRKARVGGNAKTALAALGV